MEKQVIFRDYQEQQAQDHSDLQAFARAALEHVVNDAVTNVRRFAGFSVVKTAQTEVQVQPGRFYDVAGAVYGRASVLTQSLTTSLAAAARRIVSVSVYGNETETDVEERDFLVNVETGLTEPDAVATVRSRDAVLVFTAGAESADPQPPAIPATHVEIARLLLDTIQIVSVTMLEQNRVVSTKELDDRTDSLEVFRDQIGPRVSSLASDLAALANALRNKGEARGLVSLYQDVARLKEKLSVPDDAADYGADHFLDGDESDLEDAQALGFDATVEEGLRFPAANIAEFEADIFSANDPNANLQGGLLLPAFDHALKLSVSEFHSDIGLAQFGFHEHAIVQRTMSRQRIRYGDWFTVPSNSSLWWSGEYDPIAGLFKKDGETFEVIGDPMIELPPIPTLVSVVRLRQIWVDTYTEPYWDHVVVEHPVVGAQIAQTFLVANDMWLTQIGFWLTVKAANEAVAVTLCEVTNGVPDLSKAILHQSVAHGALVVGDWTRVSCMPTFLQSGRRYALVLTANANHKFGMAHGQTYLDGTFFYSTDGAYYQGDLTKDLMLELWGAKFRAPQVTVELEALNLDGGMRAIDLLAAMIVPASCALVFEVRPAGAGAWIPLTADTLGAFAGAPPLAHFRARFVGTRDIQAGVRLSGSRVRLTRPKTALRHVSTEITLASGSDDIYVKYVLENFDDTPHDFAATLRHGETNETADVVETKVLSADEKRIERTFRFQLAAPITTFTLIEDATTNSAANVFHVAERVHWSL